MAATVAVAVAEAAVTAEMECKLNDYQHFSPFVDDMMD